MNAFEPLTPWYPTLTRQKPRFSFFAGVAATHKSTQTVDIGIEDHARERAVLGVMNAGLPFDPIPSNL